VLLFAARFRLFELPNGFGPEINFLDTESDLLRGFSLKNPAVVDVAAISISEFSSVLPFLFCRGNVDDEARLVDGCMGEGWVDKTPSPPIKEGFRGGD